jgi:hypothetical protein
VASFSPLQSAVVTLVFHFSWELKLVQVQQLQFNQGALQSLQFDRLADRVTHSPVLFKHLPVLLKHLRGQLGETVDHFLPQEAAVNRQEGHFKQEVAIKRSR